jgi:Domain of unknown function (DUF4214)
VATLTGSNGGFVQSLYVRLLGRTGSNSEVASWVNALPRLGRIGVANAILSSLEFRADVVHQLYGFTPAAFPSVASLLPPLLHRTSAPTAAEVNAWANSSLAILSIAVAFAGSSEFFANG